MGVLRVGILGAGVVGLNTALELQKELPTAHLTLLADKFGVETTSDGAAGLFRPSSYFTGPDYDVTKQWISDSYIFYNDLLKSGRGAETGIFEIDGYVLSNYSPHTVKNRLLEGVAPIYRTATQDELEEIPEKWKYGAFIKTLIIENRHFQPWALQRFKFAGGKVEQRSIDKFEDVIPNFDVIVNCTGLGSRVLCSDTKLNPIRGQVIKVRAPWVKKFYMNDYDAYIIPNTDTITLGGCRNFSSYDLRVSPYDRQAIWDRCTAMEPTLQKCEFVRDWVGLRPHRDPVRVEARNVQVVGARVVTMVHNYGHGGYGVTSAPGTAKHAVKLLKQQLSASLGSLQVSKL